MSKDNYEPAGIWLRFIARNVDITLQYILALVPTGILMLITYYPGSLPEDPGVLEVIFFYLFFIIIGFFLDALCFALFGNTPGKAILGLRVQLTDGSTPTLLQYFKRNLLMWLTGTGLFIPFISLFTAIIQGSRVSNGNETFYDEKLGFRVNATPVHFFRKAILIVPYVIITLILIML